jgi:hypothetical protein
MAMPQFTAETALYRTARSYRIAAGADGRSSAIVPAVYVSREPTVIDPYTSGTGGDGGNDLSGHFCKGVCWCCERYQTYDCCYACAVCYIVQR